MGDGERETVKKTDTGNLEKETRHVVKRERQQGVRYLNKKKDGSTRANIQAGVEMSAVFWCEHSFRRRKRAKVTSTLSSDGNRVGQLMCNVISKLILVFTRQTKF